jgi:hypothetical protein
MDQTITGAASGETVFVCGAEGFIISGKRTGEGCCVKNCTRFFSEIGA